jgi:hypothetical protein
LNWGGGSRTVVIRINIYCKRMVPLEIAISELEIAISELWTAEPRVRRTQPLYRDLSETDD